MYCREAEKALLITKYKEKFLGPQSLQAEAPNADVLSVTEANVAQMDMDHETVPAVEEDAMSSYSVSAYTTGSVPLDKRAAGAGAAPLSARAATPQKPPLTGSGALTARLPSNPVRSRDASDKPSSVLGDAAYLSAPVAPPALASIGEQHEEAVAAAPPGQDGLEWSVLDRLAAELHKQDNQRARQRELELKQKLRHDLDRQMADEKLKQERAKAEEQRYLQIQEEHSKIRAMELEARASARLRKIEATQKDRDGQLALIRSQRDEEKQRQQAERQELLDSLHRDMQRDRQDAEDRLKARRDQVHKDFAETAEASKVRKAKSDELALHEQQQVEAYEKLRAHREEKRREAAEKEAAQRKEIEKNAGLRAMAMQKMADDTELKAAAERAAKELAAERQEQATRKRLEDMKNQTQEYLLQQMKEKQLKKATEAEKARQLASAQAAEAKQLEAQEQERMARKKKMIHDHRKDLERQIAAHASDIGPQPQQCPSLEYLLLTAEARARHVPQVGVS
ncbi:unnamed protein product [Symbiodinium microadriaticum]|nr:unnamed protein product [Symbiodinium microadriaticum]CAE7855978.1 unnamed protein product [Symbiodinium sp. KB8]